MLRRGGHWPRGFSSFSERLGLSITVAKIAPIGQGTHLSISALALEFGVTRETAAKRLAEARVKPSAKRGGYPVYRLKDAWPVITGVSAGDGDDPDKLRPFERQAHYKAEHLKLQVETEKREVIPRIEVEQEQARIFKLVAMRDDTLPDILERDCGLPAHVVELIEKTIDRSRDDLYKALTAGPEEDADPGAESA